MAVAPAGVCNASTGAPLSAWIRIASSGTITLPIYYRCDANQPALENAAGLHVGAARDARRPRRREARRPHAEVVVGVQRVEDVQLRVDLHAADHDPLADR